MVTKKAQEKYPARNRPHVTALDVARRHVRAAYCTLASLEPPDTDDENAERYWRVTLQRALETMREIDTINGMIPREWLRGGIDHKLVEFPSEQQRIDAARVLRAAAARLEAQGPCVAEVDVRPLEFTQDVATSGGKLARRVTGFLEPDPTFFATDEELDSEPVWGVWVPIRRLRDGRWVDVKL